MGRLLEKLDPFVAAGVPVLWPDAEARVVHRQQAEFQPLTIRGLEVQVQGIVERRGQSHYNHTVK